MYSSFKSNLRTKSSEQLFNMVSNKSSWNDEQLKIIIEEIENRGLDGGEMDDLKTEFNEEDALQTQFERDLEIISEAEIKEKKIEKYHTLALVSGLIITFSFVFTLFGGFSLLNIMNQLVDAYFYVFINYIFIVILGFFLLWGLFIGKKYLASVVVSGALVLFFMVMSWVHY